ncbi:MAG TPA: LLM class flavin-dependent oxidoreductase [Kineosporiaceae bacterium]
MLGLYLALQTQHIRVGEMANVLPCRHPIRLAEDLAMPDHMTRGRAFVGIARGFQNWRPSSPALTISASSLTTRSGRRR